jgi:hypothetical protein
VEFDVRQHARADSISKRGSFKALVSRRRIRSRIGWLPTAIQGQRGFKSCPEDRSPATVVVIELLPNGFAGARNHHYLQLWRLVA